MSNNNSERAIRVLVADDDHQVLDCYRAAFSGEAPSTHTTLLDALSEELFESDKENAQEPKFRFTSCERGEDAVQIVSEAANDGDSFDVVILDVRMPPGIDGVAAGSRIRELDPDVEIVFVSGYTDIPLAELRKRVPPPSKLHYITKPLSFSRLVENVAMWVRQPAEGVA